MDVIDHKSVIEYLSRRCGSKDADKMPKVAVGDGGNRLAVGGRICCDSRQVRADDVFVAVRGVTVDGHDFIDQAVSKGAAVVVADRPVTVEGSAQLVLVENSAVALGQLAQAAAGWPGREMTTLAVTGTNGKTTVAYLVRAMLTAAGQGCGMLGTVEYDLGNGNVSSAGNTTPDALQLAQMMRQMRNNRLAAMVMECSSHGLDQDRVAGIEFDAAAFTNLSGDHLDYHIDRESYLAAKGKLFAGLSKDAVAVVNAQDEAGRVLEKMTSAKVWRYGINETVEISAHIEAMDLAGCEFEMVVLGQRLRVRSPLVGAHNVSNCLAAAGLTLAAGVSLEAIGRAIESFAGVPGRLERVDCGQDFTVLVDYAHTDDALEHTLETLRGFANKKLIVVFGCGGQRDPSKRPRMAAVAQKWADQIVVTNDNPRREEPESIIADIRAGFASAGRRKVVELPGRREAISLALNSAQSGDVVVIAGKGHEDYQLIGGERLHFDDREVVKEELKSLKSL